MKKIKNITTLEDHLDKQYGKKGTETRAAFDAGFERFKIGALIEQQRLQLQLTQDQLAAKCGTKKSYISRIENEGSDIRLSTLMKIVEDGLGGRIEIVFPKRKTPR